MAEGGDSPRQELEAAPSSLNAGAARAGIMQRQDYGTSPMPRFDMKGNPAELALSWKRWKRGFDLYLRAKGIMQDERKVGRQHPSASENENTSLSEDAFHRGSCKLERRNNS